ncbi:MAG: hypothetical protein ACREQ5_37950, partial [Candidatus Dormibacteria bacterium]
EAMTSPHPADQLQVHALPVWLPGHTALALWGSVQHGALQTPLVEHVPVHAASTMTGRSPSTAAPMPAAVAAMSFSACRRGSEPAMARDSRSNCSSIRCSSVISCRTVPAP